MGQLILGRKAEIAELQARYNSAKPEFVVVYGRRRVGKTYLVRELFDGQFSFYHTGLSPAELAPNKLLAQQLQSFHSSLVRYGDMHTQPPANWLEAFDRLIALLESKSEARLLVFIDEMPWMDTARSGFITALEHFWNGWAAGQPRVMLVTCGSATSWINDKLINNHGGLYGRLTSEIKLAPFSIGECEAYFKSMDIELGRYDQMISYMVFGGVPYYLSQFKRDLSLAQNIDLLVFAPTAPLRMEFDRLFASAFVNAEECKALVKFLSTKRIGYTRKEIAGHTGMNGGGLTTLLNTLVVSDFVSTYVNYGHSERHTYYRLSDMFCLFWLYFNSKNKHHNPTFWQDNDETPALNAWRGFAFEAVCFNHLAQLKQALGISGVQTTACPWHSDAVSDGAQVDMVIERADHVINLCEMKFCKDDFAVDAAYDKQLRHKLSLFASETHSRSSLHMTLVTTWGLARTPYSNRFTKVITMDDLFN